MGETTDQPTARPTNKTLVFLAASVAANAGLQALDYYGAMDWLATDVGMLRELLFGLFSGGVGLVAAWFKRDRPNQPEMVEELKAEIRRTPGAVMPRIAEEP